MALLSNKAHSGNAGPWSRRRFVQASGAVGLAFSASARAQLSGGVLQAYASATSVKAGGTLTFFVRDPAGSMTSDRQTTLGIARLGLPDQTLLSTTLMVRNRSVPASASSTGCGWPASYTLAVPSGWPSGLY